MFIETIIALLGLTMFACFAIICWADSFAQQIRRERRIAHREAIRKTFDQ